MNAPAGSSLRFLLLTPEQCDKLRDSAVGHARTRGLDGHQLFLVALLVDVRHAGLEALVAAVCGVAGLVRTGRLRCLAAFGIGLAHLGLQLNLARIELFAQRLQLLGGQG